MYRDLTPSWQRVRFHRYHWIRVIDIAGSQNPAASGRDEPVSHSQATGDTDILISRDSPLCKEDGGGAQPGGRYEDRLGGEPLLLAGGFSRYSRCVMIGGTPRYMYQVMHEVSSSSPPPPPLPPPSSLSPGLKTRTKLRLCPGSLPRFSFTSAALPFPALTPVGCRAGEGESWRHRARGGENEQAPAGCRTLRVGRKKKEEEGEEGMGSWL